MSLLKKKGNQKTKETNKYCKSVDLSEKCNSNRYEWNRHSRHRTTITKRDETKTTMEIERKICHVLRMTIAQAKHKANHRHHRYIKPLNHPDISTDIDGEHTTTTRISKSRCQPIARYIHSFIKSNLNKYKNKK